MIKFKIEQTGGKTLLVVQGQKGQQISQREYYAIKTGEIAGLVKAEASEKSHIVKISYDISGYIPLKNFLLNPLNKQSFAGILKSVLNNLKYLHSAFFNNQNILFDINTVMVNPATHAISFIYIPIPFFDSGTSLKDFLLSIIQNCSFVSGENTDYVKDYIRILNNGINFSVFDLEEYVNRLYDKSNSDSSVRRCQKCGAVVSLEVNFCSSCGLKIGGIILDDKGVYNPASNIKPPHGAVVQKPINYESVKDIYDFANTGVDTCTYKHTPEPVNKTQMPYLIRAKTQEKIVISSMMFRIGKDPFNNEYCIRDNTAISRGHAVIKCINQRWFVTDLNSTNKTYVNSAPIHPNMDVELFNNTEIRLANEIFIFKLY